MELPHPDRLLVRRSVRDRWTRFLAERTIVSLLFLAAAVASFATVAIFLVLVLNGEDFLRAVSIRDFLFGTTWAPEFTGEFGSVPLVKGTFLIAFAACLIGVPIGVGTAIYLSEYASLRARSLLKPAIEVLAGIPSIVFGVVALFVISPILDRFGCTGIFKAANAAIVLGLMVVPIIATISEDAIRAVPRELREAAYGVGATRWEAVRGVVVPAASSGIVASVLLGFSRAIGETMAVTLAGGLIPNMSFDLCVPSQTITAYIANRAGGDLPTGSIEYLSIFALGTILFVLTFAVNVVAQFILARQRRRYA